MYTFSNLIKNIRNESGLTQEDFAKALGVSTVLVAMIETGQKPASKSFIEKLATRLNVHPSSITPFIFMQEDLNLKTLSSVERSLIRVGDSLQKYLIKSKAKDLRQHV